MKRQRLEAFSDAVLAIAITIMVLELKAPHGDDWHALLALAPVFYSYVLSFLYIAIYWNNHHHLLHTVEHVDGRILWANNHLLFWLSLFPFTTAWMEDNGFPPVPTALYGLVLLAAAIAYYLLERAILASHGAHSTLARAIGADWKGKLSPLAYIGGIGLALAGWPLLAQAVYLGAALVWLVPDRRIERTVRRDERNE